MKHALFCFVLLCFAFSSSAQNVEDIISKDGGIIHVSEVVQTPGVSKDDLFSNCIVWISEHINSPKTAIQTENQQAGIITLKSMVPASSSGNYYWKFNLTIQMKEGRYKYDFTNIMYCPSEETRLNIAELGYIIQDSPIEEYKWDDAIKWRENTYLIFESTIKSLKKKMVEESGW